MPEWRIVDDVFVPEYVKTLTFTVTNPSKLLKEMPDLLLEIWRRTGPDVYEDFIKWDVTGDPVTFYGSWRVRDVKDLRTSMWGTITIQGNQSMKDGKGTVTIWLRGNMITKIPYTTPIDKSIAWAHMRLFYADRKRKYMAKAKEHFDKFENALRDMYNITPTAYSKVTE